MTREDKIFFIDFITRTGMYIKPIDLDTISNFMFGYEIGRKNECSFLKLCEVLLQEKYKIKYPSDRWTGQIIKLSKKCSLSHVVTFKRVALETIADEREGGFNEEMQQTLKGRIKHLINNIQRAGDTWYNETWIDAWLSLVSLKSAWFTLLWTKKELFIIRKINNEILSNTLFKDKKRKLISDIALKYKDEFNRLEN